MNASKFIISISLLLMASIAFASTQLVETSLGKLSITKKSLSEDGIWVIRINNEIIREIESDHADFLGIEPKLEQSNGNKETPIAKIDTGEAVSVFVNASADGSGADFGQPFVLFIKKDGSTKMIDIPNDGYTVEKIEITGKQALIHIEDHKSPLRYEDGAFHTLAVLDKAPKIKTNKSTPVFEADNEKPIELSGVISKNKTGSYHLVLDLPITVKVIGCDEYCYEPYNDVDIYDEQKKSLISSMLGKHVIIQGELSAPHAGIFIGNIKSIISQ
jgi:hypothetical protein